MDKDQYDGQAERLLPCLCEDHHRDGSRICPASYRPAVAAALREAGKREAELREEVKRLQDLDAVSAKAHNANLLEMGDLRREVETLMTERDEARQYAETVYVEYENHLQTLSAEIFDLKAKLAEAEKGQLYDCDRCGSRMRLALEKKP